MSRSGLEAGSGSDSGSPWRAWVFEPIFKRLIWGGRRLGEVLGKGIGEGSDYAESWEIADHRGDVSRIANGPWAGRSLREALREHPAEVLGTALTSRSGSGSGLPDRGTGGAGAGAWGGWQFPLLVKCLDAARDLSVQVHPNDALAARLAGGDNGKTEAWVVLEAAAGSRIYAGLRAGVDRSAFEAAARGGGAGIAELLHSFEARRGDVVFIPAGTVHAIGAGVLLVEIQQTSDATFRVYDWGRTGPDGRPRALHLAEALESIDFARGPVEPTRWKGSPAGSGSVRERVAECAYFAMDRWTLGEGVEVEVGFGDGSRFAIVVVLEGSAELSDDSGALTRLGRGGVALLPAAAGSGRLRGSGVGGAAVLTCFAP